MKSPLLFVILGTAAISSAQAPDVSIVTDIRWQAVLGGGTSRALLYDTLGRHSTVTLQLETEAGFLIRISERFQRIRGRSTENQLEFATLELPYFWRIGWVDVTFGKRRLIREYGMGGAVTTNLLLDNLPVELAVIDNGERRARGVIGRIGSRFGVSLASGNHFAAGSSSLCPIRLPEDGPGIGRGYQLIFGADASFSKGPWQVSAEYAGLRRGQTANDQDDDIVDLEFTNGMEFKGSLLRVGFARSFGLQTSHFRFEVESPINEKSSLTFGTRWDQGRPTVQFGTHIRF